MSICNAMLSWVEHIFFLKTPSSRDQMISDNVRVSIIANQQVVVILVVIIKIIHMQYFGEIGQ